jgi:hypothetical protein
LNKFLFSVTEHDRFINQNISAKDSINAVEAITSINEWEAVIFDYYNSFIEDKSKKT